MDAFFAPSTKKTNAGTPHDAFGDITNAQRKVNLGFPHDTFGGDVTNTQRKADAGTPCDTLKLTEEHLSRQIPNKVPKDWDSRKYHPKCVSIWRKRLVFVKVFIGKQTNHGYNLHLVPPELLWNLSPKIELVYLLMNYNRSRTQDVIYGA